MRRGFTLIELLVVIVIVLIVSAVALPTVLPALQQRQVSEAARVLQGALVGARDAAIRTNAPAGIRLIPDPAFAGLNSNGVLDPTLALAYNRIVPLEQPSQYVDGFVNVWSPPAGFQIPYPIAAVGVTTNAYYPIPGVLMVEEAVIGPGFVPNSPTNWYWNIRVGDKLQLRQSGPIYTVVGPVVTANPENFVNVGAPGTQSPLPRVHNDPVTNKPVMVNPEFLFVVNGQDDNANGWVDEGWDGVDNDANGGTDESVSKASPTLGEWEIEQWPSPIASALAKTGFGLSQVPYSIARRPSPASGSRSTDLPSGVVIDATSWYYTQERSRLPVDTTNGYVDIMLQPSGQIMTPAGFSSPSSLSMGATFYHFWLAAREDVHTIQSQVVSGSVVPVSLSTTQTVYLPIGIPWDGSNVVGGLTGDYSVSTLFTRSGQLANTMNPLFDNPANPVNTATNLYQPGYPFLVLTQGAVGGQQ